MKFRKLKKNIISFALILSMSVGGPALQAMAFDGTAPEEVIDQTEDVSDISKESSNDALNGDVDENIDGKADTNGDAISDDLDNIETDENSSDADQDNNKEADKDAGSDSSGDENDNSDAGDNTDNENGKIDDNKDIDNNDGGTFDDKEKSDNDIDNDINKDSKTDEDNKAKDDELIDDKADENKGISDKTPLVSGEFTDSAKTSYKISVSNVTLGKNDKLEAGVYSQTDGKDDLVWIELKSDAKGVYTATFSISQFKNPGKFTADICINKAEPILTHTFTVPSLSAKSVNVTSVDADAGTALITVSGITSESGIASVYAEVKSDSNKDSGYKYELKAGKDGSYSGAINIKNHNGLKAKYTAVIYAVDGNGFVYNLGTKYADLTEKTPQVSVKVKSSGRYYITLTNVKNTDYTAIKAAVWSDIGGQDDLTWHDLSYADGKFTVRSTLADMKHYGKCYVHVYGITAKGEFKFLDGDAFETTAPSAGKITSSVKNSDAFTININNFSAAYAVSNVKVAVWSAADQSDLVWYSAEKSDTSYVVKGNVKNHNYRAGKYTAHVYVYTKRGPAVCIGGKTFTIKENAGTITYADCGSKVGSMEKKYKIKLSGVKIPGGISKVEFAVWNTNDTGNIRWYTASVTSKGVYYVKVPISNYKRLGQYVTHVYVTEANGTKRYLNGAMIMNVKGTTTGKTKGYNPNNSTGTFEVSFSNASAPSGISKLSFAVWTKDNQSDLKWYDASLSSDGKYKIKVDIANHNYNSGTFHIHVYTAMGNGITVCASCIDYNFAPPNFTYVTDRGASGTRTVGISNPSGSNVKFAIWSETNGQDDLVWYNGSANGTNWTATFNARNHKHSGNYIVHVYSGETFLGAMTFYISESEFKNGWVYEEGYWFYYENGIKKTNLTGMVSAPYRICINRAMNTVTVYALNNGSYNIPVIAFTCSVGLPGMETPTGTYYTDYKSRWELLMGPSYGQYATHVVDGIYIHSVAGYNTTSYNLDSNDYNNLGRAASHGCIRLNVRDAKWIYDYCPYGTEVYIYDSSYAGPFGKPDTIKIPDGQTWDPTDPAI